MVSATAAPTDSIAGVPAPLPVSRLRWRCDPSALGFTTTDEVAPLAATVGQDRGVAAIQMGLGVQTPDYNLYVAGPSGTGRTTTIRRQVQQLASQLPPAADWVYVHNFAAPAQPRAIPLPAGQGPDVARDVDELVAACRREIPRVFDSEEHERQRDAVVKRLHDRRDLLLEALRHTGEELGFSVALTPTGIVTRPLLKPGQPMDQDTFEVLPDEQKSALRTRSQALEQKVEDVLRALRRLEREVQDQLRALDREAVTFAVGHMLDDLRCKYASSAPLLEYLDGLQADLIEHLDELRGHGGNELSQLLGQRPSYEQYHINVLVTHDPANGAPAVFEPNPTYYNLVGRIDYRATMGAFYTDTSLIRAGALHRANGGVLVMEARDVLLNPFSWDALKRALRDGEVRMENLGEQLSAFPTATLKPQPVPLRVKVVLVGDLLTYMLLYRLDEDFRKLFKVKAQFGPTMERTDEAVRAYAAFVSAQAHSRALLPFGSDAVAAVIEQAARLAEDQELLSTSFDALVEVLVEADYWARDAGATTVGAAHVTRALAAQEHRAGLLEDEIQRLIRQSTIAIDTTSQVVGQVNGLTIVDVGDYAFAHPARITARTGLGVDGVVNVEREVKLSGPTHAKGVMALTGYLLGQYAQDHPLSLSARLSFEQVYSEVDGDSASSAELYALLSSLAEVPIKQGIAVTGSVNQRGEVQAVGGVTRKVEGYFAVCAARGLTGEQGVIIPEANVRHLMLKPAVLDAVAAGTFHIWAVQSVDEGIALLTGVAAGQRRRDGTFPADTMHGRVQRRLSTMATCLAKLNGRATGRASLATTAA